MIEPTQLSSQTHKQSQTQQFPKPLGYVSDYAKILTDQQSILLKHKLERYEQATSNELIVVILADHAEINAANFDQYALELSKVWGVGKKYKDNGLTIIMSPTLRKVRISTGVSTEKIISDQMCDDILKNMMLPQFKQGNFYQGLTQGTDALIKIWDKP